MVGAYDLSELANHSMTPIAEQRKMAAATAFSGGLMSRRYIVVVLPYNDWILVKIRDISTTRILRVLLKNQPAIVGVKQTLLNRVNILHGIRVAVVSIVLSAPGPDGVFDGTTEKSGQP
jgi:hypothetical protein